MHPLHRVRWLFWNTDESRLRAPWRLFAHTTFLLIALATLLLVAVPFASLVTTASLASFVGGTLAMFVAVVATVSVAARWLDRRPLAALGLALDRDWWLDYAFGLVLGAGLMTLVFLAELATGLLSVTGSVRSSGPFLTSLLANVVVFVAVGFYEELLSRGYQLTNLAEGLSGVIGHNGAVAAATVLTAALFGLLHAGNPNATGVSTLTITLAGVFLALGYVLTGELAIPVGFHTTWNLFQGVVFGFPVSGLRTSASFLVVEQHGSRALTGGQFGPEAGLVGVGALLLGSALVVAYVRVRYGSVGVSESVVSPPA